ncbi:MAG: chromate efflux transporter [Acidobacteriia bacterium]|nr:chromate efflux transporter [Terriglobia bacterium]
MTGRAPPSSAASLVRPFLKLGTIAFGGPAAHIAMMEDEFVRRAAWLSREQFLDLVGASSLIPGPSSTEVAIFVGHRRAGWRGLLVAGCCFILPAASMVTALAWAYVRFGRLPQVGAVLYGVKAVIIAIIVQALVGFARTAIKTKTLLALGAAAGGATLLGVGPLVVLLAAGFLHAMTAIRLRPAGRSRGMLFLAAATAPGAWSPALRFSLAKLFLIFLKIGAVVFGSGYVLLAFLRADFVERTHWLTPGQLIDAVAVGQVTPGPVFTTATFIGYLLAGPLGAVVATVAIFLPSIVLVAVGGRLIPRLRRSPAAAAFLDGVNVASLALMAIVTAHLARDALVDLVTASLAAMGALLLFRFRVGSAWLILAAACVGAVKWWLV